MGPGEGLGLKSPLSLNSGSSSVRWDPTGATSDLGQGGGLANRHPRAQENAREEGGLRVAAWVPGWGDLGLSARMASIPPHECLAFGSNRKDPTQK